jgi:hypothetical protein
MVHKLLAPLSKWVQILDFNITMVYNYQYKENIVDMPAKLSTTVNKIQLIPNF